MPDTLIAALTGSTLKAALLKWLYVDAKTGELYSEPELCRAAHTTPATAHKILQALVRAQLVVREETKHGPQYRAPHEDARLAGLFQLLRTDSEIVTKLKQALRRFKAIEYACIFGSFAAGTTHRASDIDVLILEKPGLDHTDVEIAANKVSAGSRRPINIEFHMLDAFNRKIADRDGFALDVLAKSRIVLKGVDPWQN